MHRLIVFIALILAAPVYHGSARVLKWFVENPLMWSKQLGYMPIIVIGILAILSPFIKKRLMTPDEVRQLEADYEADTSRYIDEDAEVINEQTNNSDNGNHS